MTLFVQVSDFQEGASGKPVSEDVFATFISIVRVCCPVYTFDYIDCYIDRYIDCYIRQSSSRDSEQ